MEGENAAFCLSPLCSGHIRRCNIKAVNHRSMGIFRFFTFVNTTFSSFRVNSPSLMSSLGILLAES